MPSLGEPSADRLARMVERARSIPLHDPPGLLQRAERSLGIGNGAGVSATDQPSLSAEPPLTATRRWVDGGHRWFVDRHCEVVGHGSADFNAACESLRQWAKFRQPWTRPAVPLAPLRRDVTVGYSARFVGVWWSYCCRIIDVFDETDSAGRRRFGLDYATLRGHAERGEERFEISFDPSTGDVRFALFAISRPGRWFTVIGLPLARAAQRKFRPGAAQAVRNAVRAAVDAPLLTATNAIADPMNASPDPSVATSAAATAIRSGVVDAAG